MQNDEPKVPQSFNQLALLLLDGSPSMAEAAPGGLSKAEAVDIAVRGFLTKLKASSNSSNFSVAIITFDDGPHLDEAPRPLADVDANADYNPMRHQGSGTDIGKAIDEARRVALDFIESQKDSGIPTTVVVILMSDFEHNQGGDPVGIAVQLKELGRRIKICTALFAKVGEPNSAAEELLQRIASTKKDYTNVYDAETLKAFFFKSSQAVVR
jgi:von Willebrand factor type A domain